MPDAGNPRLDRVLAQLRLYEHPNAQVRLKAVKATLAVAPVKGRRMLEAIAGSREYPQAVPFDQSNIREFDMRSPIAYEHTLHTGGHERQDEAA